MIEVFPWRLKTSFSLFRYNKKKPQIMNKKLEASMKTKLACCQMPLTADKETNLNTAEKMIRTAA